MEDNLVELSVICHVIADFVFSWLIQLGPKFGQLIGCMIASEGLCADHEQNQTFEPRPSET